MMSTSLKLDGQPSSMKLAKMMQFENTMTRLSKDVEKLMVVSAQHGMKIKELIVNAANSVSQVEFMAAITTTRFQNLNVVNTMKSDEKKPSDGDGPAKPQAFSNSGNKEEVDALKSQVSQLENELFNQNFKSGMEIKKLENELKIRQKEIFEVKGVIRQLENKLEKFAEAVEAGGIHTNVHFTHPPTQPNTPAAAMISNTPGGRKQSLFVFSDDMGDVPIQEEEDRRNISTPGGTNLADIPEIEPDGDEVALQLPDGLPKSSKSRDDQDSAREVAISIPNVELSLDQNSSSQPNTFGSPPNSAQSKRRQTMMARRMSQVQATQRQSIHLAVTIPTQVMIAGDSITAREETPPTPFPIRPMSGLTGFTEEDSQYPAPNLVQTSSFVVPAPASSFSPMPANFPSSSQIAGQMATQPMPADPFDMDELCEYIFGQISNIQLVQSTAIHTANEGINAALAFFGASEEAELKRKIEAEREARLRDCIVQTDELAFGGKARRSSMRNDLRKASQLSNSFLRNFNDSGAPVDVFGALEAFQKENQIGPVEETPDYVYSSERKKRQSMRKSMRKEQRERASMLVKMSSQTGMQTDIAHHTAEHGPDTLDLHSGDVSLVLPVQPIPPHSAGVDLSASVPVVPSVPVNIPVTPGSVRSTRHSTAGTAVIGMDMQSTRSRAPSGFFPPPGSTPMHFSDSIPSTADHSLGRMHMASREFTIPPHPLQQQQSGSALTTSSHPIQVMASDMTRPPSMAAQSRMQSINNIPTTNADHSGEESDEEGQQNIQRLDRANEPIPQASPTGQDADFQELHIEPLFLDDLSEASSSIISAAGPPQTFLKPALGVQNVVEEAKDDILETLDRKLAKLCDHLNVRFHFVESQYQRNNAYLHTIHQKIGAINEYIFKYSYPNFQMMIDAINQLADRLGELEEWDQHLLDPLHEAIERYQEELREFRDNVDDMLQYKVREAVVQVSSGVDQMFSDSKSTQKEKSALALEGLEVEERVKKYAHTIFDADPGINEVNLFELEEMQRQLKQYAGLFENLYGQHSTLLDRVRRLEEKPTYVSQTTLRRRDLTQSINPRVVMDNTNSARIIFTDDLPPTPRVMSPSTARHHRSMAATPPAKVYQHVQQEEITQLREELTFIKALLQAKWKSSVSSTSSPGRHAKVPPPAFRKTAMNALASSIDRHTTGGAATATLRREGEPSTGAPAPSITTAEFTKEAAAILPSLPQQASSKSILQSPSRKSMHNSGSKSLRFNDSATSLNPRPLSASAEGGTRDQEPAPPAGPKPNPLLLASPRRVVLSLDPAADVQRKTSSEAPSEATFDSNASIVARKLQFQFNPLPTAIDPQAVPVKDPEKKNVWYHPAAASDLTDSAIPETNILQ